MTKTILILSALLCLAACADTHGHGSANNAGAGGVIDFVHLKFP